MIDPAQSFSNALNQGLGIFKSYRDEARLDEDRAFDRQMREAMDARAEKALNLSINADNRAEDEFSFNKTLRPFLTTQNQEAANQAGIKTSMMKVEAEYQPKLFESELETAATNRQVAVRNADSSARNARANERSVSLSERRYNDERAIELQNRENLQAWGLIGAGSMDWKSNQSRLAQMSPQFVRMAAFSLGVPALNEALQNPFGSWMNDPQKVKAVMPFIGPSVRKTEEQRGYTESRVVDVDAAGKDRFKIIFEGKNKKTGKIERYEGYQDVDSFLNKGAGYARIFAAIGSRPDAKINLAKAFAAGQPEIFSRLIDEEITRREIELKRLKGMGEGDGERAMTLQRELQKLEQGDKSFTADVALRSMARLEQSRY